MSTPLIEVCGASKSFSGVRVLNKVSLQVLPGQSVGIVGENGAGKSTLMNILGGNLPLDAGCLKLHGQPFAPTSPRDAERAGIAFIHQELNLFPNLSIAENLFLSHMPRRLGHINHALMREQSNRLLQQVGLQVSPKTKVEFLSTGERQLVEIAKAINQQAKLIIFDEPTTSLTEPETRRLFELMAALKSRQVSMIYISHTLADVLGHTESLIVLRDGEVVASGPTSEFDNQRLVSLMVGRELNNLFPPYLPRQLGPPLLEAREVSQPGIVERVSLSLRAGEILGVAGLMGSGRTELARILFGLDSQSEGEIVLNGQPIQHLSTGKRIQLGMAMLTESRRDDGLCLQGSLRDNLALVAAPRFAHRFSGLLRQSLLGQALRDSMKEVTLPDAVQPDRVVGTLSGGNQQKVVLAKWLLNHPQVLILDEPTRGVDVAAKYEIYSLIQQLVQQGTGVLMISSELEELIGMCDRLIVMNRGAISEELERTQFDRERILQASLRTMQRVADLSVKVL